MLCRYFSPLDRLCFSRAPCFSGEKSGSGRCVEGCANDSMNLWEIDKETGATK